MPLHVFKSLDDARREGFETYDRSPLILLVRREKKPSEREYGSPRWELAFVQLSVEPGKK